MRESILIPNEKDGSIKKIEYKYHDDELKLSPSEIAAYWWVERLKNLMRFMANRQKDSRYVMYLCYLAIVTHFTERDWREVYLCLVKIFEDKSNSDNRETFYQGTAPLKHDYINAVLFEVATRNYPGIPFAMLDIGLTTGWQNDADVCVLPDSVIVVGEKYEKIQNRFFANYKYSYTITGDETRLQFKNLIKEVMIILNDWGKLSGITLRRLCEDFCMGYTIECGYEGDVKSLEEEFMAAFDFIDFDITNKNDQYSESRDYQGLDRGHELIDYHKNPLDSVGLESYYEQAKKIADVICARKIDRKRLSRKLRIHQSD